MYWNTNIACKSTVSTRLTLTWDVLKSVKGLSNSAYLFRLTLTWDVLKLICPH